MASLLPPRKREWKPGTRQAGVFLRTRDGDSVEFARNNATEADEVLVLAIVAGAERLPAEVIEAVRKAYNALSRKAGG